MKAVTLAISIGSMALGLFAPRSLATPLWVFGATVIGFMVGNGCRR